MTLYVTFAFVVVVVVVNGSCGAGVNCFYPSFFLLLIVDGNRVHERSIEITTADGRRAFSGNAITCHIILNGQLINQNCNNPSGGSSKLTVIRSLIFRGPSFNPFSAMLSAPSIGKRPIEAPNLKPLRLFPSFA